MPFSSLPLTIFEEYMFLDGSSQYPMDFYRRFVFEGQLNREAFERAVELIGRRHPLTVCRIEAVGKHQFVWVPTHQTIPVIWLDTSSSDTSTITFNETGFPNVPPLDLTKESGLKIFVRCTPPGCETEVGQTEVFFQFHHSVCDGSGEVSLLNDLLIVYAYEQGCYSGSGTTSLGSGNIENLLPVIDSERLAIRSQAGRSVRDFLVCVPANLITAWRFLRTRIETLCPVTERIACQSEECRSCYPYLIGGDLTAEQTRTYISRAKASGVTINDLLIADLLTSISDWRTANGFPSQHDSIRISVPMSVRSTIHDHISASNVVSMAFADFLPSETSDSTRALASASRKMNWIKRWDQKYQFLLMIRDGKSLARLMGRGLEMYLSAPDNRATVVLSNLGRGLDAGYGQPGTPVIPRNDSGLITIDGLMLVSTDSAPPIRPSTQISIAVQQYAGRMRITVRFDPMYITQAQAHQFLEIMLGRVGAH